jgi:hypothetical protein
MGAAVLAAEQAAEGAASSAMPEGGGGKKQGKRKFPLALAQELLTLVEVGVSSAAWHGSLDLL